MQYLIVKKNTPILNIENFASIFGGDDKKTLLADEKGHIRAIEFIAFKDMYFKIIQKCKTAFIYKVECDFYKSSDLYLDARFASLVNFLPSKKLSYCLDPKTIIKKLKSLLGIKYVWGGNCSLGITTLLKYYPSKEKLKKDLENRWILKGVDCSGLLFEVTNGFTPRNTSNLLHYKQGIKIANLQPTEILKLVKPLDLIVFKRHVIIVLDHEFVIESRENFGVIKTPILDRLTEIHLTKKPADEYKNSQDYVIRRWL